MKWLLAIWHSVFSKARCRDVRQLYTQAWDEHEALIGDWEKELLGGVNSPG